MERLIIIGNLSEKGGVGNTMIAVRHVAAAAREGRHVLLIMTISKAVPCIWEMARSTAPLFTVLANRNPRCIVIWIRLPRSMTVSLLTAPARDGKSHRIRRHWRAMLCSFQYSLRPTTYGLQKKLSTGTGGHRF